MKQKFEDLEQIICPYCQTIHEHADYASSFNVTDNAYAMMTCISCEKEFWVRVNIKIVYTMMCHGANHVWKDIGNGFKICEICYTPLMEYQNNTLLRDTKKDDEK